MPLTHLTHINPPPHIRIRHLQTPDQKRPLWTIPDTADFRPTFFAVNTIPFLSFFEAHSSTNTLMGLLAYQPSIRVPGTLGLTYVSTLANFRKQGVAHALLTSFFEHACLHNIGIANTPYAPDFKPTTQKIVQTLLPLFPNLHFYEHPTNT